MNQLLRWLIVKLGLARHDYVLMAHSNYHRCTKCKDVVYIPPFNEFKYQVKNFRGCKIY